MKPSCSQHYQTLYSVPEWLSKSLVYSHWAINNAFYIQFLASVLSSWVFTEVFTDSYWAIRNTFCTHRCGVGCVVARGWAAWSAGHNTNTCRVSLPCEHGCAGPVDGWTRTTWDTVGTGVASLRCDGRRRLPEHASASPICAWRSAQGQDHFSFQL